MVNQVRPGLALVVDNTAGVRTTAYSPGGAKDALNELSTTVGIADEVTHQSPGRAIAYQKLVFRNETPDLSQAERLSLAPGALRQYRALKVEIGHETGFLSGAKIRQVNEQAELFDAEGDRVTLPASAHVDVDDDDNGRPSVSVSAVVSLPGAPSAIVQQDIFSDGATTITLMNHAKPGEIAKYHVKANGQVSVETGSTVRDAGRVKMHVGRLEETADGRLAIEISGDKPSLTVIKPLVSRRYFVADVGARKTPPSGVKPLPRAPYVREYVVRRPALSGEGIFARVEQTVAHLHPDIKQADNLPMRPGEVHIFEGKEEVVRTDVAFKNGYEFCADKNGPWNVTFGGRQMTIVQGAFRQGVTVTGATVFEERVQTSEGGTQSQQYGVAPDGKGSMRLDTSHGWMPAKAAPLPNGRLLVQSTAGEVSAVIQPLIAVTNYLPGIFQPRLTA